MTEALWVFVEQQLKSTGQPYDPGPARIKAMQAEVWLRAFVKEVERRASMGMNPDEGMNEHTFGMAFYEAVRDFGLDGEK